MQKLCQCPCQAVVGRLRQLAGQSVRDEYKHFLLTLSKPTYLPESGDGTHYEVESCGTMLHEYLHNHGEFEPDLIPLQLDAVKKHQRLFAPVDERSVPAGVRLAPRKLAELKLTDRLAYRDLVLLENEGHVSYETSIDAERLAIAPFLPGALLDSSTANYAVNVLSHHPYPDDLVSTRLGHLSRDAKYAPLSFDRRRELVLEGLCAVAGARYAISVAPHLEQRTAAELLTLRENVSDSLLAFQSRVRKLADRVIEISWDSKPDVDEGLRQVLWQLETDYEDLEKAMKSAPLGTIVKDSIPALSSTSLGLGVTMTAGFLTGGHPLVLGAAAAAVPLVQAARVGVDWLVKNRNRETQRGPLFWRYQLEHS